MSFSSNGELPDQPSPVVANGANGTQEQGKEQETTRGKKRAPASPLPEPKTAKTSRRSLSVTASQQVSK